MNPIRRCLPQGLMRRMGKAPKRSLRWRWIVITLINVELAIFPS